MTQSVDVLAAQVREAIEAAEAIVFAAKCADDSARWGEFTYAIKAKHAAVLVGYAKRAERLKADYLVLARWARQQNAGNAFATQVALHAEERIAEWDLPVEEWEP